MRAEQRFAAEGKWRGPTRWWRRGGDKPVRIPNISGIGREQPGARFRLFRGSYVVAVKFRKIDDRLVSNCRVSLTLTQRKPEFHGWARAFFAIVLATMTLSFRQSDSKTTLFQSR